MHSNRILGLLGNIVVAGLFAGCDSSSKSGATEPACPAGATECSGDCVDSSSDARHCGSCATACAPGETCTDGLCECQPGLVDCAGQCVNLQGDGANCGRCATVCPAGQVCSAGACTAGGCPSGQLQCGTTCVDSATDPRHCGDCATSCPSPMVCSAGGCVCPAGATCGMGGGGGGDPVSATGGGGIVGVGGTVTGSGGTGGAGAGGAGTTGIGGAGLGGVGSTPSDGGRGESGNAGAIGIGGDSAGNPGVGGSGGNGSDGTGGDVHGVGGATPIACEASSGAGNATSILLDGDNVAVANVNGLTFKGFGVLAANGTSELLLDYKAQQPEKYAELLSLLFGGSNPIMTHVKVEMGNDRNNSTGPEPATMRVANEPANVRRVPGFQLAADAKKLNPSLKVSILRWNAPGWVTDDSQVYAWYKSTILAAYRTYGYMVDYVNPGVNESAPDLTWTRQYADRVRTDGEGFESAAEQALYNAIQVVISDEVGIGSFGDAMVGDTTLRDAVTAAGYHYNTDDDSAGNFKALAERFDVEIWNSEAQATFSNTAFRPNNNMRDPSVAGTGIGGAGGPLEMGNTIIKGFANSRRTHFIYQPAIGSFYAGGQYSFKELVSARDPWSGWIHYDAGLDVLRHFSWFAKSGWENPGNSQGIWRIVAQSSSTGATGTNPVNGRNGTPSYLTLAAPDRRDFSTVFVNDSEYTMTYELEAARMAYSGEPSLELWETRAADAGSAFNSNYLRYRCNLSTSGDSVYRITVSPYSVVTATTLANLGRAGFDALPVEGVRTVLDTDASGSAQDTADGFLYADDFDYSGRTVAVIGPDGELAGSEDFVASRGGPESVIPRYFSDRNGAFEVFLPSGSDNYVLRQQVDQAVMGLGGTWNNGNPITGVGDNRWLNYKASVDVSFENEGPKDGTNYASIGARQQGGSNSHYTNGTPYLVRYLPDGGWQLFVDGTAVSSGNVVSGSGGVTITGFDATYDAWHNLALEVVDARVTAYLDDVLLATYDDPNPRLSGRVDLASGYYFTRFDNLKVETVAGHAPYYTELLDNLEMHDLAPVPARKLVYGGGWAHENGKSMYNYQRSLSTSQGAGSTLQYTFAGSGVDILGPNDGSAELEVTVDGEVVEPSASTMVSGEFYQTFMLRGLGLEEHTVAFRVLGGTLIVDAVAVLP